MNREKVEEWVSRMGAVTSDGSITKFELWSTTGEGDALIDTIRPTGEGMDAVEGIASQVFEAAEQDAASRPPVPVRYVLTATRADAATPEAQIAWMLRGRSGSSLAFAGEAPMDAPTERGALGLALRTMENQHRMIALMVDASVGNLARQVQNGERRCEALEQREAERAALHQRLMDRKAERDLELAREEAKSRRQEKLLHELFTLVPLVIGHVLANGAPLGKGVTSSALRDRAIGRLLEDLDETQLGTLVAGLTERQRLAFWELYKSYREDRVAEMRDEPELVRAKPSDGE